MSRVGCAPVVVGLLATLLLSASVDGQCSTHETAKLVASNAAAADYFAVSVALDDDTLVIGAYGDDYGVDTTDSGAAYVFAREAGVWGQQDYLVDLLGNDLDYFGYAVAVDGETVIVGAYLADVGNALDAGAAYVFVRSGGTWTQQAKLVASDAADDDWFGYSVAVAADTAVIGAHQADLPGKTDAGAAYVFLRSGSVWIPQTKLTALDGAASDYLGRSVAISRETTVIGANGADLPGKDSAGAAYVFVRTGSVWTQQGKLVASDAAAFDNFGFTVAADLDTAVIEAIFDDHAGGSNAGSAYVFFRSGGAWSQQAKLTASDAASSDSFGRAVALSGDAAMVGANQDDHSGRSNAGSAYQFARAGGSWTQRAKAIASDSASSDFFGSSVAIDAASAVIGAAFDDHAGGNDAGSVYVVDVTCTEAIPAVSSWGVAAMTLLILIAGTVLCRRREQLYERGLIP